MSDEGIGELLRLYALLRGTADPRTRSVIREQIDAMPDRAQGFLAGAKRRNGHDRTAAC